MTRSEPGTSPPTRPVSVMHLVPMLRVGGMERGVAKLANSHDRQCVRPAICSFMTPDPEVAATLQEGVPLYDLGRRDGNDPAMVWRLVRLLRKTRPDIVHAHSWGTLVEGYAASRLARIPFFVHGEHGTLETRKRNLAIQRWVWRRADRVLSVSARLAERMALIVGFSRERITTIPNGLDHRLYGLGRRQEARRMLGLPPDALVVGTVGRLVEVKGHELLIEAVAELGRNGISCQLVIVGEGPLRARLEARGAQSGVNGALHLLGARNDVPMLLEALDVFALSSRSEGMSNTLQEAMASGLAIVATRVGGADELIEQGKSGLLVEPRSAPALALAIGGVLQDSTLRRALGAAARVRAREQFSLLKMTERYERLYDRVCRGAPQSSDREVL